jgi:hypothetical protein
MCWEIAMNWKRVLFAVTILVLIQITIHAEIPRGRFETMTPIASLGDGTFRDCCNPVSSDGLLLMFSSDNRPGRFGEFDIFQVSRSTTDEPFGPPTNVGASLNSFKTDAPSWFSPDGLTLLFYSDRPGGQGQNDIYMATRSSFTEPFGNVINLGPGVNTGASEMSAIISATGLTVYFYSDRSGGPDTANLWQATRNNLNEPFSNATLVENVNSASYDDGPTISADELHMFFFSWREGQSELYVTSRTSTNEPFSVPVNINNFSLGSSVNEQGVDELTPYISTDWPAPGSKLYFTRVVNPNSVNVFQIHEWEIYEATWVPGSLTLLGDYNNDGTVDAADYVVWRKGLGTTYTQTDYNVWRAHFGETAGNGEALPSAQPLSAIPEPSSCVLAILALAAVFSRVRRRRHIDL